MGRILALTLAVGACAASSASAATLVVDDDTGCADRQFTTIQAAVDAAAPGDTVKVCPGLYVESVSVATDRVKLQSRVRHAAVIEQPAGSGTGATVSLFADLDSLRGFTIRGATAGDNCEPAVWLAGPGTVDYNRIIDSVCPDPATPGGVGVLAQNAGVQDGTTGRFIVAHNEITNFGSAAVTASFTGFPVLIQNNDISTGPRTGIAMTRTNAKIQSNTVEDVGGTGIVVDGFETERLSVAVNGNTVRRSGAGIVSRLVGAGVANDPVSVRFTRNRVFDNAGNGISNDGGVGYFKDNTSLRNGGFDCFEEFGGTVAVWKNNVGVTDSPSNLCKPPN